MMSVDDDDDDECDDWCNGNDEEEEEARLNLLGDGEPEKSSVMSIGLPMASHGAHSLAGCAALTRVASKTLIAGGARSTVQ